MALTQGVGNAPISNYETTGCAVEETMGAINEITSRVRDRIEFARNINDRLHSLKIRLVGHSNLNQEGATPTDQPPAGEVAQLSESIDELQALLTEIDTTLANLERL